MRKDRGGVRGRVRHRCHYTSFVRAHHWLAGLKFSSAIAETRSAQSLMPSRLRRNRSRPAEMSKFRACRSLRAFLQVDGVAQLIAGG